MTAYLGRSHIQVTFAGNVLPNVLAAQCHHRVGQVADARVVVRTKPTGTYYDAVTITGGRTVTNVGATRFTGYLDDYDSDLFPGYTTLYFLGKMSRADEFENSTDPSGMGIGGLRLIDLVGANYASDQAIVTAVLNACNVDLTGATIGGTGRLMGNQNPWEWIWKAGTPTDPKRPQLYREKGQTGWAYIREVDRISAVWNSGLGTGGFYSTFDGPSAPLRKLIGGRPTGSPDLTFTEGVDILRGSRIKRARPVANAVLVKGCDYGDGNGPIQNSIQSSNSFMVYPPRSVLDSYSSPLIEFTTEALAAANGTAIGAGGAEGMSCETIMTARLLDLNREPVGGSIVTYRDEVIAPGQAHLVQGPGGAPDRLAVGELLWCIANTAEWVRRGSVLVFRQRPEYIGGGTA